MFFDVNLITMPVQTVQNIGVGGFELFIHYGTWFNVTRTQTSRFLTVLFI